MNMIEYSIKLLFTKYFRLDESGIQLSGIFHNALHAWDDIEMAGVQMATSKSDDKTLKQMGEMFTKVFEDILRTRESVRFILFKKKDGTLVHLHVPENRLSEVVALFSEKLPHKFNSTEQDYFKLRKSLGKKVNPISLAIQVIIFLGLAVLIFLIWATMRGMIF